MVVSRLHPNIAIIAALLSLLSIPTWAQISTHQRIGVERKTDWELGFELGSAMTHDAYDSIDYLSVDSYASVDLLVLKRWTASVYVPVSTQFAIGDDARKAVMAGVGDLELAAGWTGRIADTRVSASLQVAAPTGQWSDYAMAEGVLVTGSGRWSIGTALSASMILDPVVLGATFAYDVGLPRTERFSTSWRPGDMSLSLSITEVLNDRVGYSLKAVQSAALPELHDGSYNLDSFSYAAVASIELWYSDGDVSLRFGVSKSATNPGAPARLYAAVSYALRSEKEDE